MTWGADGPNGLDAYAIADLLSQKGWSVDRQHKPACIHCTVSPGNVGVVETYLADLREAAGRVRADPSLARKGEAAVYGLLAKIPLKRLVDGEIRNMMAAMYVPGGAETDVADGLPDAVQGRQELVHKVLDLANSAQRRIQRLRGRA